LKIVMKIFFALGAFSIGCLIGLQILEGYIKQSHQGLQVAQNTVQKPAIFYTEIGDSSPSSSQNPQQSYAPVSQSKKVYSLQVGTARSVKQAEKYLATLTRSGLKEGYYSPKVIKGKTRYLLRYGVYEDNKSAEKKAKFLTKNHRLKPKVILLD